MPDSESFSYHVNKVQVEQLKPAEVSLITLERAQKLDLLMHLISNLRQSLVVCGPYGIGKTTLLNELDARKSDVWSMLTIQVDSNSSFESIQGQLFQFLIQNYTAYKNQPLASILPLLDKQGQKLIVVIDDAGLLVPGLITSLIQYASTNECLRVIFALTHDELHIKSSSDRAIDDCHFIEIPPLTEKQCGTFLQNMSSQPNAAVSFNAISDRMILQLYRETHGIPGKIMSELPKLSNYHLVSHFKWGRVVLLAALMAIGVSYFVSNESNEKPEQAHVTRPLLLKNAEDIEISKPVIESIRQKPQVKMAYSRFDSEKVDSALAVENREVEEIIDSVDDPLKIEPEQQQAKRNRQERGGLVNTAISNAPANEKKTILVVPEIIQPVVTEKIIEVEAVVPAEKTFDKPIKKKPAAKKTKLINRDDSVWLLKQAKGDYTIQLMVLSRQKSMQDFLNKYPQLKKDLKYFQINKQGKTKYVLVYGSYKNAKVARKKMKSLPAKYRKSWIRRFKELHKEIK